MMLRVTLLVVVVGAQLLSFTEARGRFQLPRVADGLLNCGGGVPTLRVQPNLPHAVWSPFGSQRRESFQSQRSVSHADLFSLLASTPGSVDDDRQLATEPSEAQIDVINTQQNFARPSRQVTIDEILPLDSPFFADNTVDAATRTAVRDFVRDSGIGQCGLVNEWTDMGEFFFPRWFAGVRCEEKNCSVPTGQSCFPNFRENPNFLFVLNWDCCYVPDLNLVTRAQLQCGWRKVQIPLLSFCECNCSPIL